MAATFSSRSSNDLRTMSFARPERPSRAGTATLDAAFLDSVLFRPDRPIVHSLKPSKLAKRSPGVQISKPMNPAHLTHLRFNHFTGELNGLPEYYCRLLKDSGCLPSPAAHSEVPIDMTKSRPATSNPTKALAASGNALKRDERLNSNAQSVGTPREADQKLPQSQKPGLWTLPLHSPAVDLK
ncbi:hypothetical protein B0H13DRAFT_1850618 [Mycena leptocephala]|nr:hypothetical protein B0H13DRAFT_1850618 [Mycena leptocephala]